MERKYRKLNEQEITQLGLNGCISSDWGLIEVAPEGFITSAYRNVRFSGKVRLGKLDDKSCGVYNASLTNCTVGDNVFISNVGGTIINYDIADGVRIENVGNIICDGKGNFGNGVEVKTLNEAGGREVIIFNTLSAQFAYMMAMYRHDEKFTAAMRKLASAECEMVDKTRGHIDEKASVICCGNIYNTNIGSYACIEGVDILRNGSVNSLQESPAFVGAGVKAYDFIISSGACVDNGAVLERCFIGEKCHVDYYFSATDSLFFANSEVAGGEACSIFAGPFTVSHHRSSLLIAGYFSFFNAGSGSNQSNHLFKTGAVHQGIHERGCKFGSNAYVMLPAREGAFSTVMGRHANHHDTCDLPYSYLVEEEGKTFVIPGANLRSCGTSRDYAKWPARDKRIVCRDRIHYQEYNPYTGEKLLKGIGICERLAEKEGTDIHTYNRVKIKNTLLKRGHWLYTMALDATLGNLLSISLDDNSADSTGTDSYDNRGASLFEKLTGNISDSPEYDKFHWCDIAGMYAPIYEIEKLCTQITSGEADSVAKIEKGFDDICANYTPYAKAWALFVLESRLGHSLSREDIQEAITNGREAESRIQEMRQDDTLRDDDKIMQTGYGMDNPEFREADMFNVRKTQRKK